MGILDETIRLPAIGDLELGEVCRPRHGDFDVALVRSLAQVAKYDESAAGEVVKRAIALTVAIFPDEKAREVLNRMPDLAFALDVADAICEALELDDRASADLALSSDLVRGQCRDLLLGVDGEVLGERGDGDPRPAVCAFGCPNGHCAIRAGGASAEVGRSIRDWRLCGGAVRHFLPVAGGLEDQDAATLWRFQQLDDLAARAVTAARSPAAGSA